MSELVGKPVDRFSRVAAHFFSHSATILPSVDSKGILYLVLVVV